MSKVICQLRRIRHKKKLTLEVVAKEANVSVPYLSEVERGLVNPRLCIVERILAVYDKELAIVPSGVSQGVFSKLKIMLEGMES